ncbi:ACP phosphodiesterase [Chitinivorax sp. B]|uniref:acyl carrier protein phosphodiesterase n=1 Tax=Chitinivorax sp. B TaxID=2502235 RepID=UPI0010F87448|nr:ACP phosphodiesterase [Chitinivorax sp. B]
MPNYLAHLLLAENSPQGRVGNLLGDFMKLQHAAHLPLALQRGMSLHQAMDGFTDRHPCVLNSKGRITPLRRRYAGILVDIFYDHFLAQHWTCYASVPLEIFTNQVYAELSSMYEVLPPRLQDILPIMSANNWLLRYRDIDGIDQVLQRFSQHRLSRANPLGDAIIELTDQYQGLGDDFQQFFPELQAFTLQWSVTHLSLI